MSKPGSCCLAITKPSSLSKHRPQFGVTPHTRKDRACRGPARGCLRRHERESDQLDDRHAGREKEAARAARGWRDPAVPPRRGKGDLDYLVVDLPPGTSDAQLTLAQSVPISGAVLVTTPQQVAIADVQKALAMFARMSVPVIGLVENMSAFVCPHCGEATEIFGRGGGERFARAHDIEFLGDVPLDITVRQGGDAGIPVVAQREPGPAAQALTALAKTVAAQVSVRAARQQPVLRSAEHRPVQPAVITPSRSWRIICSRAAAR